MNQFKSLRTKWTGIQFTTQFKYANMNGLVDFTILFISLE